MVVTRDSFVRGSQWGLVFGALGSDDVDAIVSLLVMARRAARDGALLLSLDGDAGYLSRIWEGA